MRTAGFSIEMCLPPAVPKVSHVSLGQELATNSTLAFLLFKGGGVVWLSVWSPDLSNKDLSNDRRQGRCLFTGVGQQWGECGGVARVPLAVQWGECGIARVPLGVQWGECGVARVPLGVIITVHLYVQEIEEREGE